MVKGLSRRVILIKSPDPKIFEEAIFIVREDSVENGVTQEALLREARTVANNYIREHMRSPRLPKLPAPVYAAIGSVFTAIVLLSVYFIL